MLNLHRAQTVVDAAFLQPTCADRVALTLISSEAPPQAFTGNDLRNRVARRAASLLARGLGAGDGVIIARLQDLDAVIDWWAAAWIGAIPSMFPTLTDKLDRERYTRDLAELVTRSGARAILTTPGFAAIMGDRLAGAVITETAAPADDAPPCTPDLEAIALLQHSSGTTGLQKGVMLSHRAILNQLAHYADAIRLNADDVIVSWLPLYHDMGLIAGFLLPLIAGVPLVMLSPFDWVAHPAMLPRAIHDYGGTLCWLPNFAYNHLARRIRPRDLEGVSMASMRMFINSSEPVRADSHAAFLDRFAPHGVTRAMLGACYAMAENTFAVTATAPGQPARLDWIDREALQTGGRAVPLPEGDAGAIALVSCGAPMTGCEVRAVDADGGTLPPRRVGEIAVRGSSLFSGYHARPDLDPFRDGWYLTGDQGYEADGEWFIIGRSKDLIIHAGKNLYPADLEAAAYTVPGVQPGRACAFGVMDAREGTELIALVIESDAPPADHPALMAAVRAALAGASGVHTAYVQIVPPRWLVKTSSGKIARAANRYRWLADYAPHLSL